MSTSQSSHITQLLIGWTQGNRAALDEMLPLVYEELKRVAAAHLRRERRGHTLQTTGLVHEAYSHLIDQRQVDWRNRAQFLGVAAEVMRRILLHHARKKLAAKRGGGAQKVSLSFAEESFQQPVVDLIALDHALVELSEFDARKSKIVELKFFGGMTTAEISEVLQLSSATVEREWSLARAWLHRALSNKSE